MDDDYEDWPEEGLSLVDAYLRAGEPKLRAEIQAALDDGMTKEEIEAQLIKGTPAEGRYRDIMIHKPQPGDAPLPRLHLRDPNEKFIEDLQARIDAMTPRMRKRQLVRLRRQRRKPLRLLPELIALEENVSVARACELAMERLRDGTVKTTGTQMGGGPRESISPAVFRQPPH